MCDLFSFIPPAWYTTIYAKMEHYNPRHTAPALTGPFLEHLNREMETTIDYRHQSLENCFPEHRDHLSSLTDYSTNPYAHYATDRTRWETRVRPAPPSNGVELESRDILIGAFDHLASQHDVESESLNQYGFSGPAKFESTKFPSFSLQTQGLIYTNLGTTNARQSLLAQNSSLPLSPSILTSQQVGKMNDMHHMALQPSDAGCLPSYDNMHHSEAQDLLGLDFGPDPPVRLDNNQGSGFEVALRCPHPSCSSKLLFTRRCDRDKHYRLHFRKFFCRITGCHMSHELKGTRSQIGFSTMKDRDRHEKGHNPSIVCPYCGNLFSRNDNFQSHCQRLHSDMRS